MPVFENRLQTITAFRDFLAARMFERLSEAEFGGKHVSNGERQIAGAAGRCSDRLRGLAVRQERQ